jgi:hypothetical protein
VPTLTRIARALVSAVSLALCLVLVAAFVAGSFALVVCYAR